MEAHLRRLRPALGLIGLVACVALVRCFLIAEPGQNWIGNFGSHVMALLYMTMIQPFIRAEFGSWGIMSCTRQITSVVLAALILFSSTSVGLAGLRWLRLKPKRPGAAALFGAGLGLGLTSAMTLILGSLGLCHWMTLGAMLVVF